ncbi:phospholipid-binding lipoprotein MlaA [Roseovarius sp. MBR-78]|jgi:phospholipid-binding lipoprotein MlaA
MGYDTIQPTQDLDFTVHAPVLPRSRRALPAVLVSAMMLVAGCATQDPGATRDIFDPYEGENRNMHEFNRGLDRALIRPVSKGYTSVVPDDIETGVVRIAENLSLPADIVNNLLQLNMRGVFQDSARLVVNTTVGIGGIFDPASEMGMAAPTNTDFGETLHVWGAREGAYIELPVLGPSTTRRTFGYFVDLFTNPLTYLVESPESLIGTAAGVASGLSRRERFSDTIDQILYESEDSYALSRSIYLQNRRFKLGGTAGAGYTDPYDSAGGGAAAAATEVENADAE